MTATDDKLPPLIAHIIYRLDVGGLENGLVNLLNRMPEECYRHAIICISDYSDFSRRITNRNVQLYALHKSAGKDPLFYFRLWRLLRRLQPDIVHSRNLAALACQLPAALAGCRARIHGEHGRDISDVQGSNTKYTLLRRIFRHLVGRYIALSKDLSNWLQRQVGVPVDRIVQIYNGVDQQRFHPGKQAPRLPDSGFPPEAIVIGTVGRMQGEKDQLTLVQAFLALVEREPAYRARLRLVLVGDGPLMPAITALVGRQGAADLVWMPGMREDIPQLLRDLDIFVLPSLIEGVSNTILEAMASGVPVVATRVGGNPELVVEGETGHLVPPQDVEAMADALDDYVRDPELRQRHGAAGRQRVEQAFSMERMVESYLAVYDQALGNLTRQ